MMIRRIVIYLACLVLGGLLGWLMQWLAGVPGEWSYNLFRYMATDLGSWAVICVLLAAYADSALDAGIRCFCCMGAMVAVYYLIVPASISANEIWVIVGFLTFPIGMFTYFFKEKLWVMVVLELGILAFFALDVVTFIEMLQPGYQIIIENTEGIFVYTDPGVFTYMNYAVLMAFTIFGLIYVPYKYVKTRQLAVAS